MTRQVTYADLLAMFKEAFSASSVEGMVQVDEIAWKIPGRQFVLLANEARFYASVFQRRRSLEKGERP